jgi:hypothetical protein
MEARHGILLSLWWQMPRDQGGFELGLAHVTLHGAEVDPGCKQMRGIGMPEGMGSDVSLADIGAVFGCAKSALDAAAGHRRGGAGHVFVIASGSGKEPGAVAGRFPGGA